MKNPVKAWIYRRTEDGVKNHVAKARSWRWPKPPFKLPAEPAASTATLTFSEYDARNVLLVHALEECAADGDRIRHSERFSAVNSAALQHLEADSPAAPAERGARYLGTRATELIQGLGEPYSRWSSEASHGQWFSAARFGIPIVACILGLLIENVSDPHRINLLSPPLIFVLAWNICMYAAVVISMFRREAPGQTGVIAFFRRRFLRSFSEATDDLDLKVRTRFLSQWIPATWDLQGKRFSQILHAGAAGWGVGILLALFLGGVVHRYEVGWESTFLDANGVRAILEVLFAPVRWILPFRDFSVQDVQAMAFGHGASNVEDSRRWIWMFMALVGLIVVIPRALLATWYGWLSRKDATRIRISKDLFAKPLLLAERHLAFKVRAAEIAAMLVQEASRARNVPKTSTTPLPAPAGGQSRNTVLALGGAVGAGAGAVGGAKVGATIDIATGGLTLGAGALVGAAIGATAGYLAAGSRATAAAPADVPPPGESRLRGLAEDLMVECARTAVGSTETGVKNARLVFSRRWDGDVLPVLEEAIRGGLPSQQDMVAARMLSILEEAFAATTLLPGAAPADAPPAPSHRARE
ncbi:MAG: DUF2868 domain-containing protein [Pseudomonadota bacterium]